MNKTARVSLVRRVAAGVIVAVSLTSSFVASAVTTTPLTPYLDKGYAIAPNKLTQSIVCFDASKAYSSTSKAPTAWSFTATDAGSAFKSAMSDSEGPLSNPDEAKLRDGGRTLLLTGSWISGWAEIDVATKQARRYKRDTTSLNTHSIEKLPDGTLVTANSTGDGTYNNCLVLITTDASGNHTYKKAFSLYGAHGVEWDEKRNCLWACGNSASDWKGRATLYKLTYDPAEKTLTQVDSIQYKSDNDTVAHGLRLSADGSIYCTAYRIYKVDPDTKTVTEVLYPSNQAKGVHYDSTYGMVYQISGYISGASDNFLNDHVTVIPVSGDAYDVYPQDATRMYKVAWALSTPAMYVPYISNGESFWCGGDGSLADANCANDVRTAAKAAFKSGNRLVFGGYESPDITVGAATSAAGITAIHGTTTLAGAGSLALSGTVDTGDSDAVVIIRTPVSGTLTKVGEGTLVLEGTLAGVTALDIQAGTVAISNALPKGVTATVAPSATFIDGSPAVAAVDRLVVTAQPQEYAVPGAPYGETDGYEEGTAYTKTISAEPLALETGVRVKCVGWKLYKQNADGKTWDDWQTGAGSSVTYTHPDRSVRLVWQFAKEYNVALATSPADCGTLSEPTGWYFEGTNLSITASAEGTGGLVFWRWAGDVTSTDNPLALAVNGPKTLTANYRDPSTLIPVVRYVSPTGAGTKDGSSPENASDDLAAAYADAAGSAVADNPSEVHLAAGLYTITAPIAMKPYVKVIGATDGETILSGDQGKADYWRLNNGGNYGSVIQNGAIYLPDYPADSLSYYSAYDPGFGGGNTSYEDTEHAFTCETEAAPTNVFQNLAFVLFVKAAIYANGASADGLTVENCKFYGNNHMACRSYLANGGSIDVRKGAATVKDCFFRYNDYGIRFSDACGTDVLCKSKVVNCQFLNNHAKEQYSTSPQLGGTGGVVTDANSLVDILDCTFFRCGYTEGNNNGAAVAAGAVAIHGKGPTDGSNIISNCTFVGNFIVNAYGNTPGVFCTQGNLVEIVGCSFVSNCCSISSARTTSAAVQLGVDDGVDGARLIVRDSYFAYNLHTNTVTSSGAVNSGSVFAQKGGAPVTFLNCTIENNSVYAPNVTSAQGNRPATFAVPTGAKNAFVNCLIRNNDSFVSGGLRGADIKRNDVYNSSDLNIVNTVMTHDADDYIPFADPFLSQRGTILATSVIKNFTWGEDVSTYTHQNCTDYGCLITPVKPTADVTMSLRALKEQGGVVARGICCGATRWVQKGGTPVYRGTDNRFYIYNPTSPASASKPWWCLDQHQSKYTDAQLAAVGVVKDVSPVVPDAFGAARSSKKSAIGPLNVTPGTMLIVR